MILDNTLITLDFNPAKDLLCVEWPDYSKYSVPEFNHLLHKILDTVRYYDIGYLLLDAQNSVDAIKELEYMDAAILFLENLAKTRIKKVARLVVSSSLPEKQSKDLSDRTSLSLEFQTFANRDVALSWLAAK